VTRPITPPAARRRARWLWHGVVTVAQVCRRTLGKAWHDRILGMSAESAFWQLPSLLIALLGLLGYGARWLGDGAVNEIREWALATAAKVVTPRIVDQVVAPMVSQVLDHHRSEVIGLGGLVALWSGSSATATFVNTITIAYGQRDLRGAVRSRFVAMRLYLFTVLAGVIVLPAVVLGPGVLDDLFPDSWQDVVHDIIHALFWPVLAVLVFCGISTFYHLATPLRLRWRRAFPGAAFALALFLVISYGLQVYISDIATRMLVYSTLAAPILTLMYFYGLAFAVLLGAEFNATLEERWPRGTKRRPTEWLRDVRHDHHYRRFQAAAPEPDGEPDEGTAERAEAAGTPEAAPAQPDIDS
jgi:membrane protein